jgi:urea carboxylase
MAPPFEKIVIANRGAIACRIIRTCKRLGIGAVAVFSDADTGSLHVAEADEAIRIGAGPAADSYLRIDAILEAARKSGAQAIHPGYGFLSENASFAEACEAAGLRFIGPTPTNMRVFGLKHTARALAEAQGVRLAPGSGLLANVEEAAQTAAHIGYPVMLKATAGGGGIGMRICEDEASLRAAFGAVTRLGAGNFGDGGVFLERFVRMARHVEVQVFGDGAGRVMALGERDCSVQRRNQKVIEETPAPLLPPATREALIASARDLMAAAKYRSAGTVEYLYDAERDDFFFLEVNTRLQVEHGVTEQVTQVDLVEWMIRGAAGDYPFLDTPPPEPKGASIQARLYAEDPGQDFRPSAGLLTEVAFPTDVRTETWVGNGAEVSAFYDPLLAKLIVTAPDRDQAITALQSVLDRTTLAGIETNLPWLRQVARDSNFVAGHVSTRLLDSFVYAPDCVRVLSGGPNTTIQDYPGRLGYWAVGVPPSGPMDARAFRLGNRLLGNEESAAGIEFASAGPTLLFQRETQICLTGADCNATLDGVKTPPYAPIDVRAGQTLKIGRVSGAGLRGYLAVRGGWDAPLYLGSRSTFTLGGFGGHAGRALSAGDVLRIGTQSETQRSEPLLAAARPALAKSWELRVLYGPHGAPDFFTVEDIDMLQSAEWRVHHNSNPTGIRLIGPKPQWARRDGGEAGLHPSNIHDNAYAVGSVDFTGDMPIILGPDGPSLGGFVCPFVVIEADLWKIGQLAPGDTLRFVAVSEEHAADAMRAQHESIATLAAAKASAQTEPPASPVLHEIKASGRRPRTLYRRQGDCNLLIEYGPIVLDVELRLRVHALMQEIERHALEGIVDLTPGVRSLQVHYNPTKLPRRRLLDLLISAEDRLGALDDFEIASRIVYLPLSWGDPAIYQTIEKYIASVRDDAPWTPDNIEFIRRINGLSSIEDVKRIIFEARYLVLGLGDVYLGAPVATPMDPRHRLVTTKYNPARTWTPPNVVGIGGAYLCVYGMEGPGGYQLFGRTIQVWNSYRQTKDFTAGKPWLLRFFDQIRFFPVSHEELTEWRREFPLGRRTLQVEHETFRISDYRGFLAENADSIAAFQHHREAAFQAEREDWRKLGEFDRVTALATEHVGMETHEVEIPPGCEAVESPLAGSVWQLRVAPGERVAANTIVAVIEAMKAEYEIAAGATGIVRRIFVKEKQPVSAGAPLLAIEPDA